MALNIKDPQTDRVARELARRTGENLTVAIRVAIEERLDRLDRRRPPDDRDEALRGIIERGRRRAVLDARDPDPILGYDADGLPA